MKRSSLSLLWQVLAGILLVACQAGAQTPTQNVQLVAGWNAVWLEVEPVQTSGANAGQPKAPQDVFTNPAILAVATPKPLAGLAEFFAADPTSPGTFNQDEWQQWKRTDPTGTNNLGTISGNRPYLIQVANATPAFGLPVAGKTSFFRPTWTPDRYNLLGFALEGTVSFDTFFGPSSGKHPVAKIFRLNSATGAWQHVTGGETMVSNQAYWIFSTGASDYMGPVSVSFEHSVAGVLNFGGPADAVPTGADLLKLDLEEIVFTNLKATGAAVPQLEFTAASAGPGSLALHVVRPATDSLSYLHGNLAGSGAALGESVAPKTTSILTLGGQRTGTFGAGGRTQLYRLKTGAGSMFWLPVSAYDSDLPAALGAVQTGSFPVAGLWVGEVIMDAATSIVENGEPVRPTAGSAPLRILLHSNSTGSVRLLSQVTMMQTKTASPELSPVPVLVVDQARIPFFEGIKERNGKRVGIRLEAVAYDMPRKTDIASQSGGSGDLIDMIVAESTSPVTEWLSGKNLYTNRAAVSAAAIDSYLLFRSIRPPGLVETYHLAWPMSGSIGAGQTVQASIVLDSFHRSNPFRHAFHQQHGKGPKITRDLSVAFDPTQAISDQLGGTFSETIHGLIKTDLHLSGRLTLRRVSPVTTLEGAP